eukprot:433782_1
MNHFIHIKHIIQTTLYKNNNIHKNNQKKITILVHLRRTKSINSFPLILSETAKIVFLDSLSQRKPIQLNSFSNQTIQEICKDRGIELLKSTFQRALSHLEFTKEINLENEIKKLSEIFNDKNENN